MRIIAFITDSADNRKIRTHIGAQAEPLRTTTTRGSTLRDEGMRRSVWLCNPRLTGTMLVKRHPSLSLISASEGEGPRSGMTAAGR